MRATFFLGAAALLTITVLIIFKIKEPQKRRQPQSGTNSPRQKTNLLRIPVVQRMLITAGVVQMTILFSSHHAAYVAELQGEHGSYRARNRHSFFGGGSLWRLCVSGLGDCRTKMGVPTGALFRTPWHDDIRRDPGHSE